MYKSICVVVEWYAFKQRMGRCLKARAIRSKSALPKTLRASGFPLLSLTRVIAGCSSSPALSLKGDCLRKRTATLCLAIGIEAVILFAPFAFQPVAEFLRKDNSEEPGPLEGSPHDN